MKRRSLILMSSMAALGLAGCGPPWTVVRQASPNPLIGNSRFVVMPIDFSNLRVGEKDEVGYLAEKDVESKTSWAGDKVGMNGEYFKALLAEASGMGIAIVGPNERLAAHSIGAQLLGEGDLGHLAEGVAR
jgi:hypothetical protein